jgi:hypothetical protein
MIPDPGETVLGDRWSSYVPFARAPLYAALLRGHPAANKDRIAVRDLKADEWILLAKNVHPIIHEAILQTAQFEGIAPKDGHDVITAHQAVHLVSNMWASPFFSSPPVFGSTRRM